MPSGVIFFPMVSFFFIPPLPSVFFFFSLDPIFLSLSFFSLFFWFLSTASPPSIFSSFSVFPHSPIRISSVPLTSLPLKNSLPFLFIFFLPPLFVFLFLSFWLFPPLKTWGGNCGCAGHSVPHYIYIFFLFYLFLIFFLFL